jgi:hypothetical protein
MSKPTRQQIAYLKNLIAPLAKATREARLLKEYQASVSKTMKSMADETARRTAPHPLDALVALSRTASLQQKLVKPQKRIERQDGPIKPSGP